MGTALWTIAALIALGSCAAAAQPSRATYTNPVLDADFPDPTVIRAPDGYYYGYATQTQRGGKWVNIQLARSTDLVHWRYYGDALPAKPGWAAKTQDFWAPHVQRDGRRYILAGTLLCRGLLCWGMSAAVKNSVTLLPAAFGILVLQT